MVEDIEKQYKDYWEAALLDPSNIKTLKRIKSRTEDYHMFERIIISGVGSGDFEIEPTEEEIKKYIDIYLLELHENSGITRVDAWDERHRENVRSMMEAWQHL